VEGETLLKLKTTEASGEAVLK